MEGRKSTGVFQSQHASLGREEMSVRDAPSLLQETVCDPWPVTKLGCRKDTALEAAQVLVRARNTRIINICSNEIILLPAIGSVPGV